MESNKVPSRYNVFFKHENNNIGFNGYSLEYIVLDELLFELYNNAFLKKNFTELKEVHNEFYEFLIEKEFLVDDSVDEFERIKMLSQKIDSDESNYVLTINPTMNCNFKCWYCYETHIKDSKMDEKTIASTIKLVEKIFEEKKELKNFTLSWFGGEPLLYFEKVIKPILKSVSLKAKEYGINFGCGITTNGLLINQSVLDFSKEFGLDHFQITLDGNKERHDKVRFISEGKGSYDKIVDNILLIAKNKLVTSIRVNYSTETMSGFGDIINDFENIEPELKKYIKFDFHKVWQVGEKLEDEANIYRLLFREKGFFVRGGVYDTVTGSCYADKKNHATINYNGEVFKCTARDFKSDNKEGSLNEDGSITWNEKFDKRLNSKFKNAPCKECKILPICGGGCTQQAIENENVDYCIHNFSEESKMKAVQDKFLETLTYS